MWWKNGDPNEDLEVYEWNVHPFGVTSSPFCANYALQRTIVENLDEFRPILNESVLRDFYVDDYLTSSSRIDDALLIATQLPLLLKLGGFDLIKWTSNSSEVESRIPPEQRLRMRQPSIIEDPCQIILGVKLHVSEDALMFEIPQLTSKLTRRALLGYIAAIFDPLGFIAPVVLRGKLILQNLCRDKVGWDVELNTDILLDYDQWIEALELVKSVRVQRCLIPNVAADTSYELHMFSDASEFGYGAVAYLLQIRDNSTLNCCFLMGKSRVAPLKFVTVPRLELVATLTATKLSNI